MSLDPGAESAWYVEGYAYSVKMDLIFEHAWVQTSTGEVLETTWDGVVGHAYFRGGFHLGRCRQHLARRAWSDDL